MLGLKRLSTFVIVALLVLPGCGQSASATPTKSVEPTKAATTVAPSLATPTKAAVTPKIGGTLTYMMGLDATPPNFDAHYITGTMVQYFHTAYESLLSRDRDTAKVTPLLAETWEFAPDAKSITLKLRKGVKWQNIPPVNGREFTSEDVKWNIERMAFAEPAAQLKSFVSAVSGVETPDKYTARIVFKQAFVPFVMYLAYCGLTMYPKELVDTYGKEQTTVAIGTGPYIVKSLEKDVSVTLTRNPNYYMAGLPRVETLKLVVVRGQAAMLAAMRSGQADAMSGLRQADVDQLKASMPTLQVFPYLSSDVLLRINTRAKPVDDVRVRKAMHLAIDRQELIKAAEKGSGEIMGFYAPVAAPYNRPVSELLTMTGFRQPKAQDIAEAKKLLAEAGYGSGVTIECAVPSTNASFMAAAEVLVEQLAKVGINFKVKPMEVTAYSQLVRDKAGNFQVLLSGGGGAADPESMYIMIHSTGTTNVGDYGSPEMDKLLDSGRAETDETKRIKIYRELEDLLFAKLSLIPLYSSNLYWAVRAGIEDIKPIRYPGSSNYYGEVFKYPWISQ